MTFPVTDESLAQLYASIGLPLSAEHFRSRAASEKDLDGEWATDLVDALRQACAEIPDSKLKTHGADCWQLHAACLAERLIGIIDDESTHA